MRNKKEGPIPLFLYNIGETSKVLSGPTLVAVTALATFFTRPACLVLVVGGIARVISVSCNCLPYRRAPPYMAGYQIVLDYPSYRLPQAI